MAQRLPTATSQQPNRPPTLENDSQTLPPVDLLEENVRQNEGPTREVMEKGEIGWGGGTAEK
jgi:hypothetical protein